MILLPLAGKDKWAKGASISQTSSHCFYRNVNFVIYICIFGKLSLTRDLASASANK